MVKWQQGRTKEGELATTSLGFELYLQFPCGSLSTELSDFRQSAQSKKEPECKQTLKNTCQGYWRHYLCHFCQSGFRIDFFDADIQIPESWLQALLPLPPHRQRALESLLTGYGKCIVYSLSALSCSIYNHGQKSWDKFVFYMVSVRVIHTCPTP